ncbi:MAG: beta-ketoacyl-[acyl-carrier-protein] synthase family protein [Planctomycetota bacterium]|nr:MAG: beta-ketoacyl-[acyl-carrier-protein] synthase family protein [Planctomycetota bacterium]
MTNRRRVVVTGLGMINPLGTDPETVWSGIKEGTSAVDYISIFDATGYPTRIAAEVRNWDVATAVNNPEKWIKRGRHAKFAAGAARQAIDNSGILDAISDRSKIGVYFGAGEGPQDFGIFMRMVSAATQSDEDFDVAAFMRLGSELLDTEAEVEQEPSLPAAHLAEMFDLQGPNLNCLTACAASSQAIGEATEMIRRGEVTAMLAGGAHSMIHEFGLTGFSLLTALSTNNENPKGASRPFDRLRDGFVMGEGGSVVILEELEHAKRRGAQILGEVIGYGCSSDAYRITDIHPAGRGAIACMSAALQDARIGPEQVDYVNAHGTSTSVNDRVETVACKAVFGERAYQVPVSSTKSMMGHLIAAAGATEMIMCLMAIRDNILPPTINLENPDPDCDLDYVPNEAREADVRVALNNSFGFGGQNVTLAVSRYDGS